MFSISFTTNNIDYVCVFSFFFFNDTATTEIYTLSLHDALPISPPRTRGSRCASCVSASPRSSRSEEHTSELQSRENLVCRLLLEKKNNTKHVVHNEPALQLRSECVRYEL